MTRQIKLGQVTYELAGKVITWYLGGKKDGQERFASEWEAQGVFEELEVRGG